MEIFSGLNENKNLSLALGYFDGVHKGHQEVIKKAVQYARKHSVKSAVVTFKDHPCCYFWDVSPKYILTREERQKQIERLGIDYLYELDFGEIAHLNAEEYLEKILVKNFSP
ncbi:MAG: bifunctional riboflavin kinase/FMN adenylyltransferase, partial [Alphaproteobacteria bacterium]|nr:bifunctional riboflavin kinase/FMN adenylyltransferase [Alphaproteobacteria bacterium]